MMIRQSGIDPEKDIKVLALGSDAARLTALKPRVVDVAVILRLPIPKWKSKAIAFSRAPTNCSASPISGLALTRVKSKKSLTRSAASSKQRSAPTDRSGSNRDEAVHTLIAWGKVEKEFAYASYDALRNLFNSDGAVPEDGLKLVIEQTRRGNKVDAGSGERSEVVDLSFLREAQAELGIKGR